MIDPNVEGEQIIAIQKINKIEKLSDDEINNIVNKVYGTQDKSHPEFKLYDQKHLLAAVVIWYLVILKKILRNI